MRSNEDSVSSSLQDLIEKKKDEYNHQHRKLPWIQSGQDIDGEATLIFFGAVVSLSNDGKRLAVGADADFGIPGYVQTYKPSDGHWIAGFGDDAIYGLKYECVGRATSLSGDGTVLAVGGNCYGTATASFIGRVRIFKFIDYSWTQIGSDILGKNVGDMFGVSVSLSYDGTVVAVGALLSGNTSLKNRGCVQVFKLVNNTWTQIGDTIFGQTRDERFGASVALSSNAQVVVVGSPGYSNSRGRVQAFHAPPTTRWFKLGYDMLGKNERDFFGNSVAISSEGKILAAGCYNGNYLRVYNYSDFEFQQLGDDIDGGGSATSHPYNSVSLSSDGTVLAVGVYSKLEISNDTGHVRVFQHLNGNWTQRGSDIKGEAPREWFGFSVSLSGNGDVLAVGAPLNDVNGVESGQARVFFYRQVSS